MADKTNIRSKISADGASFFRELKKVEGGVKRFGSNIAGMLAGFFTVGYIARAAQRTIEWASATTDLAQSLGVTTDELQELEYASKKTGATIESVAAAFRRMSKFRTEALANKDSKAGRLAEVLGISPDELRALDNPLALFTRIADVFRTKNFGGATPGMIEDIFSEQGTKLLPMMIKGVRELRDEARGLGIALGGDVLAAMDMMADRQKEIVQRLRGPMASSLATVYGWVLKILNAVDALAAIIVNMDFSKLNPGAAMLGSMMAYPPTKNNGGVLGAIDQVVQKGQVMGGFYARMIKQVQDVFKGGIEAGMTQFAGDKLGEALANRAAGLDRGMAGGEALDILTRKTATSALKTTAFKPPSDALARIGGFVGRGNARAENWQKETAQNTKKVADQLQRGLKLQDQL